MSVTLNLNNAQAFPRSVTARPARVWTRSAWSHPWTLRPDLHATQCVWSAYPEISTASLHYRYGYVCVPGDHVARLYPPITARGYWVLIAFAADDVPGGVLVWLGYAESPVTERSHHGDNDTPPHGTQTIPCFGMERVWDFATIESTVIEDPEDEELAKRVGNDPATFNRNGVWNRGEQLRRIDGPRQWSAYAFGDSDWWSTRDIVQHLLGWHAPTPSRILPTATSDPTAEIPWRVTGLQNLPDWDNPVVATSGRTVGDVLRQLITPGRMSSLAIGASAVIPAIGDTSTQPLVTAVSIVAQTRLIAPTVVPSIGALPYDPGGISLFAAQDPLTRVTHTLDSSDVVDSITVQGPREISVCTLEYGSDMWDKSWTDDEATTYNNGASTDAGYSDLDNEQRQQANSEVRSRVNLAHVHRDFILSPDFAGLVRDGKSLCFDPDTGGDASANPYIPDRRTLEIMPDLPLRVGNDYSGPVDEVEENTFAQRMEPLVTFAMASNEVTDYRETLDLVGNVEAHAPFGFFSSMRPFSVDAQTHNSDDGPGLRLTVSDSSQLSIANVTVPAADVGVAGYDYATMESTVAILCDRRTAVTLESPEANVVDVVRRRVYTLSDTSLQAIYMPPGTVVGINSDGERETSDGGLLRDPRPQLAAIAQLIATHVHTPRHRVTIATPRLLSSFVVGANLRYLDVVGDSLGCPVIQVRIDSPVVSPPGERSITMTIVCAAYRFDVLSIIRGAFGSD